MVATILEAPGWRRFSLLRGRVDDKICLNVKEWKHWRVGVCRVCGYLRPHLVCSASLQVPDPLAGSLPRRLLPLHCEEPSGSAAAETHWGAGGLWVSVAFLWCAEQACVWVWLCVRVCRWVKDLPACNCRWRQPASVPLNVLIRLKLLGACCFFFLVLFFFFETLLHFNVIATYFVSSL